MTLCYSAIDTCWAQFNRLDCDDAVLSGASDIIVTCATVDVNSTPILGEARDQKDPNGRGGYCAQRNDPASIEGYEVTLTLCSKTDIELMELLGLGELIFDAEGNPVGWKSMGCDDDECYCDPGEDTCVPAVSMHLWHTAWCDDARHPDYKWIVEGFPKVTFDPGSVSIQRNNEFNTYTLTGRAMCNDQYGQGPGSIYPDPDGLGTFRGEWATNTRPGTSCDCSVCGYAAAGAAVGN